MGAIVGVGENINPTFTAARLLPQESQMQLQLSGQHTSSLVVPWMVKLDSQLRPLGESPVSASCPGSLLHLLTFRDWVREWSGCGTENPSQTIEMTIQLPLLSSCLVHAHFMPTSSSHTLSLNPKWWLLVRHLGTHQLILIPCIPIYEHI